MSLEDTGVDDIGADIAAAMEEIETGTTETADAPEATETVDTGRDEKGRFKGKEAEAVVEAPAEVEQPKTTVKAPQSWSADMKAHFATLPEATQQYIAQRESDAEKVVSRVDDERRAGKEYREMMAPFSQELQSKGVNPNSFMRDILDTVQGLRSGNPQQKAQTIANIAHQYGVNIGGAQQMQPQQAQISPDMISKTVAEQLQQLEMSKEIQAFASDPANKHFETVKPLMGRLLESGAAQTMKDAYEQAIWANPEIRTSLLAEQTAQAGTKRAEDIAAKKKAGSSVTGSPGIVVANTGPASNPSATVEDDVREAMKAHGW